MLAHFLPLYTMKRKKEMLKDMQKKVANILTFIINNKEIIYENLQNKATPYKSKTKSNSSNLQISNLSICDKQ